MTDLVRDLLEEIFLQLPLKLIIKFKTVSKQWRSILESRRFGERRRLIMNPQIMAAIYKETSIQRRPLKDEKEVELFYLHYHKAATRPSLTCEGLVCIPVPGYVNVLNPSTREFLSFPYDPNPVRTDRERQNLYMLYAYWSDLFAGVWVMGFGKDIVNRSYKVVRMCFDTQQYAILDVNIGEWRKLSNPHPPPHYEEVTKKSACVNGSIYWLQFTRPCKILALDLHTEEFHDVQIPISYGFLSQLVNLEDRLSIAVTDSLPHHLQLCIWTMEAHEETWTKTYTIRLFSSLETDIVLSGIWCRPVAVSKQGNLFFHDSENRLFKYCPETDQVDIIERNICVISPLVENLFQLRSSKSRTYGFQYLDDLSSF